MVKMRCIFYLVIFSLKFFALPAKAQLVDQLLPLLKGEVSEVIVTFGDFGGNTPQAFKCSGKIKHCNINGYTSVSRFKVANHSLLCYGTVQVDLVVSLKILSGGSFVPLTVVYSGDYSAPEDAYNGDVFEVKIEMASSGLGIFPDAGDCIDNGMTIDIDRTTDYTKNNGTPAQEIFGEQNKTLDTLDTIVPAWLVGIGEVDISTIVLDIDVATQELSTTIPVCVYANFSPSTYAMQVTSANASLNSVQTADIISYTDFAVTGSGSLIGAAPTWSATGLNANPTTVCGLGPEAIQDLVITTEPVITQGAGVYADNITIQITPE